MAIDISFASDEIVLTPGQSINVPIHIHVDKPTKVRGIHAKFLGVEISKAVYTSTTTDSEGKAKTETKTAVQRTTIVEHPALLYGEERLGCMAGLMDMLATLVGGGKNTTLQPGQYDYDVDVSIPADAPESMKGEKCSISYELTVVVDLPAAIDKSAKLTFPVKTPTDDRQRGDAVVVKVPEDERPGFFAKMFGKKARLRLATDHSRYYLGDTVRGLFQITAEEPFAFKKITATLVGVEKTKADGHTDSHRHHMEPISICESERLVAGDSWSDEFELPVQISGAPTSTIATNFTVDWMVRIEVDVAWSADPVILADIEIQP